MTTISIPYIDILLDIFKKNNATVVDISTFLSYLQGDSFADIARQQGLGRAATQARVARLRNRTLDEVTTFLEQQLTVKHACIRRAEVADKQLERLLKLFHYDADFRPIVIGSFVLQHRQFRHQKKLELMLSRAVLSFLKMSKIRSLSYLVDQQEMANVLRARFPVASNPENDALLAELFYIIASQKYAVILFSFQQTFYLTAPLPQKVFHDVFFCGSAFSIETLFKQFSKMTEYKHGLFSDLRIFRSYIRSYVQQVGMCDTYVFTDDHIQLKKTQNFSQGLKRVDVPLILKCMYANASEDQHRVGSSPNIDFTTLVQCVAIQSQRSCVTVERSLRQSPLLLHLGYGKYASLRQEALEFF